MAGISVPPPRRGPNQSLESYREDLLVYRGQLVRQAAGARANAYVGLGALFASLMLLAAFIAGVLP